MRRRCRFEDDTAENAPAAKATGKFACEISHQASYSRFQGNQTETATPSGHVRQSTGRISPVVCVALHCRLLAESISATTAQRDVAYDGSRRGRNAFVTLTLIPTISSRLCSPLFVWLRTSIPTSKLNKWLCQIVNPSIFIFFTHELFFVQTIAYVSPSALCT